MLGEIYIYIHTNGIVIYPMETEHIKALDGLESGQTLGE